MTYIENISKKYVLSQASVRSMVHELSSRRTKWFTDNQSGEKIAVQGSVKVSYIVQDIAVKIDK